MVYADRPETCRRYACGWLQSKGSPDCFRPDRSSVLIGRTADGAYELAPLIDHATERGSGAEILRRLVRSGQRVVIADASAAHMEEPDA